MIYSHHSDIDTDAVTDDYVQRCLVKIDRFKYTNQYLVRFGLVSEVCFSVGLCKADKWSILTKHLCVKEENILNYHLFGTPLTTYPYLHVWWEWKDNLSISVETKGVVLGPSELQERNLARLSGLVRHGESVEVVSPTVEDD